MDACVGSAVPHTADWQQEEETGSSREREEMFWTSWTADWNSSGWQPSPITSYGPESRHEYRSGRQLPASLLWGSESDGPV